MDKNDKNECIGGMTIEKLKAELKKRGAKTSGKKGVLIERYV